MTGDLPQQKNHNADFIEEKKGGAAPPFDET